MRKILCLAVLIALAAPACREQPTDPASKETTVAPSLATAPDAGDFMPLEPGNHWTYDRTFTAVVIPDDGPPEPPFVIEEPLVRDQVEYHDVGDTRYVVERDTYGGDPESDEHLIRQDREGYYLFERPKSQGKDAGGPVLSSRQRELARRIAARYGADPASIESHLARVEAVKRMARGFDRGAVAPPPGGPMAGELVALAYPLHPGATWVVEDEPLFTRTVEARERFEGVSAWRVRLDSEYLGENDVAHMWFSRCGEVGHRFHIEGIATDVNGERIGTIITDDVAWVRNIDIDRGGCDMDRGGGGNGGGAPVRSYPLAVGNHWVYDLTRTEHAPDTPPVVTTMVIDDVQEEWVELEGHEYIRQTARSRGDAMLTIVQHLRQDRDGLYDGPAIVPTGSRAGFVPPLSRLLPRIADGPDQFERQVLAYPLHVGQSWTIVEYPTGDIIATVESRDRLSLPAGDFDAYRIRIEPWFQNPEDESLVWYGPQGMVRSYFRARTGDGSYMEELWELREIGLDKPRD